MYHITHTLFIVYNEVQGSPNHNLVQYLYQSQTQTALNHEVWVMGLEMGLGEPHSTACLVLLPND